MTVFGGRGTGLEGQGYLGQAVLQQCFGRDGCKSIRRHWDRGLGRGGGLWGSNFSADRPAARYAEQVAGAVKPECRVCGTKLVTFEQGVVGLYTPAFIYVYMHMCLYTYDYMYIKIHMCTYVWYVSIPTSLPSSKLSSL